MDWSIIEYEKGRHTAVPNGCCRYGIPIIIPMVSEFSVKARLEIRKPALPELAFIPAEESKVQFAVSNIRYIESVWRHGTTGGLVKVPDVQLQSFLDGLEKRERKPLRAKKTMNLGAEAEQDWFALYSHLYGLQAAIKRFGKDLREMKDAA